MTGTSASDWRRGEGTESKADCVDGQNARSGAAVGRTRSPVGWELDRSEEERRRNFSGAASLDQAAVRAHLHLGVRLGAQYQWVAAEPHFLVAIAGAADLDRDQMRQLATSGLAYCHLAQGEWDSALDLASAVLAFDRSPIARGTALEVVGRIGARRGEASAVDALDEALALAGGVRSRIGMVRAARAESAWLRGDRAAVIAETVVATGLIARHGHEWWTAELAYWHWRAGAEAWPEKLMATPFAWQMAGECERSALAWDGLGCPYEAARARAEGTTEETLRAALASFDRLGAGPALREARRRWRILGLPGMPRGPNRSTRSNPAHLTRRQAQILGFVAEGCSNQIIASRLFLSKRTVEAHVFTLFTKLGVSCREEAARLARERGLVMAAPDAAGQPVVSAPVGGFGGCAPPMPNVG